MPTNIVSNGDPTQVVELDNMESEDDMSFETPSVNIETRRVKQSKGKQSTLVKVIWSKDTDGAIWVLEEKIKE